MKISLFSKYSNGWGHLVMSLATLAVGLALILMTNDATMKGTGVTLILTTSGAWYMSGSAKQIATEVTSQLPGNTEV